MNTPINSPAIPPRRSSKLKWILIGAGIFAGFCVVCFVIGLIGSQTPEFKATQTAKAAIAAVVAETERAMPTITKASTATTSPIDTPAPTNTPIYWDQSITHPTVYPNLYQEILANKDKMTDIQLKDYLTKLVGTRAHFRGQVKEVHEDGEVYLTVEGGGFFDSVYLRGLPTDVAIKLNKDQVIEFDATIREFTDFIIFSVNLDNPVLYSIQ